MERRLTAILSADVAGYSRLVEDDDEATIRTLTDYRQVMRERIDAHHGRVVDAPGDNLLAEFASVVDAVRCAAGLQRTLLDLNVGKPPERQMLFRMGINVGDVVVEDGSLYGDGVNIAARLESLAEPGGICISGNAYEQIENKLDVDFEFVGERPVKNISKPVSVWQARIEPAAIQQAQADKDPSLREARPSSHGSGRTSSGSRLALISGGIALAIAAGFLLEQRPGGDTRDSEEQTADIGLNEGTEEPEAQPSQAPSPLPARPAIIVLPFANISDDPDQDYFSDGITEDITTDLSKLRSLIVVPSNAAFKFKDASPDPEALQREFGIRYLLEGSIRRSGGQIRINARLIDVVEGEHLWAERYDRALTDIFALQDDIREKILTALRVNLTETEKARFEKAPTTSLEAYDFYLRAHEMSHRARRELRPELMVRAAELFHEAIALDPDYAAAYGALGLAEWLTWSYDWADDSEATLERALEHLEKSLALDDTNPGILRWVITGYFHRRQHDLALATARDFVERAPQDPTAYRMLANTLLYIGEYEEAYEALETGAGLDTYVPGYSYWINGMVLNLLDRNEEAIAVLEQAVLRSPNYLTNHVILAAIYAKNGRLPEARQQWQEVLRISPNYEVTKFASRIAFVDESIIDGYTNALLQAGLR